MAHIHALLLWLLHALGYIPPAPPGTQTIEVERIVEVEKLIEVEKIVPVPVPIPKEIVEEAVRTILGSLPAKMVAAEWGPPSPVYEARAKALLERYAAEFSNESRQHHYDRALVQMRKDYPKTRPRDLNNAIEKAGQA